MKLKINIPKCGFANPGLNYNTFNYINLAVAALQIAVDARLNPIKACIGLAEHFVGNLPAITMSAASIAFFVGGNEYDRAFKNNPPDVNRINSGHILSAIGAFSFACGIMALSLKNIVALKAAVIGGTLHTIGKLGSVVAPQYDRIFKQMPLASRAPAISPWGIFSTVPIT